MRTNGIPALRRFVVAIATCVALASAAFNASATYTSVTVFGDSLSDNGNLFALTGYPPPPYFQGRFSNGPTATELLAGYLGVPLTDYAFGGAETGTGNYLSWLFGPQLNGTGILSQAQNAPPSTVGPQSLVVLWGGPNDLFAALDANQDPVAAMMQAASNLATDVGMLYADGARTIVMPNMPDIGATPFGLSLGASNAAQLTAISLGFDSALAQMVPQLEAAFSGLDIIPFDTFALLAAAEANPAAYGFTNATAACFNGATVCADPDQYLFWDSVHPTARGHQLIGAGFYAAVAVPEPATLVLLALGLVAIVVTRSRRRA